MYRMIALISLLALGCVTETIPRDYVMRAHPECENIRVDAHRLSQVSQSEVSMDCGGERKTIAVKCQFGWGILADTTCHENN